MIIDIQQYIISLEKLDLTRVPSTWIWLIGNDKNLVALTKAGDALLKDANGNLYFLDTGSGTIELLAENYLDFFNKKLGEETEEEILLPMLVDKLESNNLRLGLDQIYSYILLPVIGGEYDESNLFVSNLYEHYNLTGNIHFQLKDMPNGTVINIAVEE